ncbi:hypothetical protein F5Y09DRAFT_346218 [Xylaria sp. FL1042]|nr:hypothetical protein F5Y09DRAFT_346218 [Xylaria sp. FL1042]
MSDNSDNITTPTEAVAGWQAFAAEGKARLAKEVALMAKYDQLYPLFACERQPAPIRFYGPGPEGRVHPDDPPVGTLHYARWRHELAAIEDSDGSGYYHEEHPLIINGQQIRPTYTTKGNQTAREVNYFRWERVTADSMKAIKTFPGSGTSRAVHDEYLLNEHDFNNNLDIEKPKVSISLGNREDEDPETIYRLGYKLLKRWSQTNGYAEWKEGGCLGPDPHNPDALTKHLGWISKPRKNKVGLGADPQDAVWNELFHGNLDAKRKDKFSRPKDTWSADPAKITIMTSSKDSNMAPDLRAAPTIFILSLTALKATLSPPEPDTLRAREAWIDAQAAKRHWDQVQQGMMTKGLFDDKPELVSLVDRETTANMQSIKLVATEGTEEVDIKWTEKLKLIEIAEHNKNPEVEEHLKNTDTGRKHEVTGSGTNSQHHAVEEHEAIETRLKELSRNPEPGKEGKTPILIYSSFRSKFLGTPVTQIVGYEE